MSAKKPPAFSCLLLFMFFFNSSAQTPPKGQVVETFFNAITENDTNTFFKMLDGDTNLTHALYYDRLPLHVAASKGRIEMVAQLLKRGADINAKNDTLDTSNMRLTALEAAIEYNHPDVCKLLLEAGADPNLQSSFDGSALHYAFTYHRNEMAGWLLDHGANPFLEKNNPYNKATPLELAITAGDGMLVPRMLDLAWSGPVLAKSGAEAPPTKRRRQPAKTAHEILAERGVALLAAAAQRGELEAVQALIKAGIPARTNTDRGDTLLQAFTLSEAAAAKAKDFPSERWMQIRDLLIKNGADYDVFAATALGDTNQAQHLLLADKNVVKARDRDGQTPLHWAVMTDQLPLTSFWLQAGVPTAATNSAGQTALHLAAAKGLAEHLKILLEAHAPTDIHDTNGWTPLDAAMQAKQPETIRLLMSGNGGTPPPGRGIATSLHEAAASGNVVVLAAQVESATNLEVRNELGLTPLQVAVLHGHLAAAALLVDKGADVNVRDPDGNILLHQILLQDRHLNVYDRPPTNWLARMGQDPRREMYLKYLTVGQYEQGPNPVLQTASFLLACGTDARATNQAGQTAVQLVTGEKLSRYIFFFGDDQAALLKLLGTGGGNVNEADANGDTALHRAGQDSTADRAASLIAGGADVNATNHQGRTPLHKFAEKIYGWDLNEAGTNEPFQLLVKSKANVNAQDNEGLTPLHVLALADTSFKKEATRLLLDAGANPNLRDKHGRTPVHLFLAGNFFTWSEAGECIEMLGKAGANLSAKDNQGKTPLHYLAALGSENPMSFIHGIGNTFVEAKADIEARDNDGNTPLHIAAKTGSQDVYKWLVQRGARLDTTNNAGATPLFLAEHTTNVFAHFGFPKTKPTSSKP